MMMAVVLGTALAATGNEALAQDATHKAITDIGKYCSTCWRNARLPESTWADCTQEVFRRLLERMPASSWRNALASEGEDRRELFRAIDAAKKKAQRSRRHITSEFATPDHRSARDSSLSEDLEAVRHASQSLLSERQQQILRMSLEGYSVCEISQSLGLPVQRVSDEKYKAIRKLRASLTAAGSLA
jgi:RNA polymerase sigma factor (sigma-70 family)